MARQGVRFLFTILSGQTLSNEFTGNAAKLALGGAVNMTLYGPTALTGVVTIQVAPLDAPATSDFLAWQVDSIDQVVAAAKAKSMDAPSAFAMRLSSTLAEGANRLIPVVFQLDSSEGYGG